MTISGKALSMRHQLAKLMEKHRYSASPFAVALTAPTDRPMILEGLASSADVDLDRCKFGAGAFVDVEGADFPPLYFKHDRNHGCRGWAALTDCTSPAHPCYTGAALEMSKVTPREYKNMRYIIGVTVVAVLALLLYIALTQLTATPLT